MDTLEPTSAPPSGNPAMLDGAALADHVGYLGDESRRVGRAAALVFPRCTAEVCAAVRAASDRGWPITVSGARTGIAAGAVPDGGLLLSLERMNRVCGLRNDPDTGAFLVRCEAGLTLAELQRAVREKRFADAATWDDASAAALAALKGQRLFYPPDPTETSASLGGTVACNASGAHSFRHGPTRRYVQALEVVLADGRVLELARGQCHADADGRFGLRAVDGSVRIAQVPDYAWPCTKNAAGYYTAPGMDLIDLFIGSEGTLGIVTKVESRLIPAPALSCSTVTFWPDEAAAVGFSVRLRARREALELDAIEYMDPQALEFLRARRRELGAASGVPAGLPETASCAVYLDVGSAPERFPQVLAELHAIVCAAGADPEQCWSAVERDERERLRLFRHALPEAVNACIAETRRTWPEIVKLGTDMAVPDAALDAVLRLYRGKLANAGLRTVVFGHIGDNHLHVNILPRTPEEYRRGRALYREFAEAVVRMGGSPAAEHGIGKLKTEFLEILFGADGIEQMRALKRVFDPDWRLGPGTLFATGEEGD